MQEELVLKYINAKDKNRPHMMSEVFCSDATLEMKLQTQNIMFPSRAVGIENITEVLISTFSKSYRNVFTFCFQDSNKKSKHLLSTKWLVCMIEKGNGKVRFGYGKYDWFFSSEGEKLVKHLTIQINEMFSLDEKYENEIYEWIYTLSYPFCNSEEVLKSCPNIDSLQSIKSFLK
mgnify:CR=1 FL=1